MAWVWEEGRSCVCDSKQTGAFIIRPVNVGTDDEMILVPKVSFVVLGSGSLLGTTTYNELLSAYTVSPCMHLPLEYMNE